MQELGLKVKQPHLPVLYQEVISLLQPYSRGFYVDGTLGAGGHAWGILQASSPDGKLLGLDIDPFAIKTAHERLVEFKNRVILRKASYTSILEQIQELNLPHADGIILDLGFSSLQIDSDRGFSFNINAPLDMRFDPDNPRTAAFLVNELSEKELEDIIFQYGEEKYARHIAKQIVQSRPIETTQQLVNAILKALGKRSSQSRIHPATRTFQALRIATNDELNNLKIALPRVVAALKPGGRLAVISFHSLEDRIVKDFFRQESQDCICPPRQPICTCGHKASILVVTRHPVQPTKMEIAQNPRSRSARLRVAQRIEIGT